MFLCYKSCIHFTGIFLNLAAFCQPHGFLLIRVECVEYVESLQVVRCFEDDDIIHVAGKVRGCCDDSATFFGVGLQRQGGEAGEAVGAGGTCGHLWANQG